VIAAINGAAVGAGMCLALSMDIRVCSKAAKLGFNFSRLGLHPGSARTLSMPIGSKELD
jgi:enoyl-CoA hydratase/carnithine racemase